MLQKIGRTPVSSARIYGLETHIDHCDKVLGGGPPYCLDHSGLMAANLRGVAARIYLYAVG
jgi:hypothetical protein